MPSTELTRTTRSGAKVMPAHARLHNRALVLRTLFRDGALSRADLARRTELTRVTISDLVGDLIERGIVVEHGARRAAGPGKPGILVDIDRPGHQVVGIDLSGADRFVGVVLNLDGDEILRDSVPRPPDGAGEQACDATITLAQRLVDAATMPVLGIGIGSPGVINDDGRVLTSPNIGWQGVDLQDLVHEATGHATLVANDANAAALAERILGDGGRDLLLIRTGRGFGAALLSDGEPVPGSRFASGEIGHVTVGTDGGPACACGKNGCLEAWVSTQAVSDRIAGGEDRDTVVREAAERLGIALAPVVGMLDITEIVVAAPQDPFDDGFLAHILDTIRHRTLWPFSDGLRVVRSSHGDDIVAHGAVAMVISGRLGVS